MHVCKNWEIVHTDQYLYLDVDVYIIYIYIYIYPCSDACMDITNLPVRAWMHACMYVRMYVDMHACMDVRMYVFVCVHVHVYVNVCM